MKHLSPLMIACFVLATPRGWSETSSPILSTEQEPDDCQLDGHLRIETYEDYQTHKYVCHITGHLLIFVDEDMPDGDATLSFPHLKSTSLINFHSSAVEAIHFPELTATPSLYVKGERLESVGLPKLETVARILYLEAPKLQYLDIAAARQITDLWVASAPSLKYIFAENLTDVGRVTLDDANQLESENVTYLNQVGATLSPSERRQLIESRRRVGWHRDTHRRNLGRTDRPPRRATQFGTRGFYPNLRRYPSHYRRYFHGYGYYPYWRWTYPYPWRFYFR